MSRCPAWTTIIFITSMYTVCVVAHAWPCSWPLLSDRHILPEHNNTKALQLVLNERLGTHLKSDGIFGPSTKSAVERFQAAHRLEQDGVVGPSTWAALLAPLVVGTRHVASGPAVSAVQLELGVPVSSTFDVLTEDAVKRFQRSRGAALVDGVVAMDTWHLLISRCNSSLATSSYGFDVGWPEGLLSTHTLRCLHNYGFTFSVFEVHLESGTIWKDGIQNIVLAKEVGMSVVDAYHFPDRSRDGVKQAMDTAKALTSAGANVSRVWLDIEGHWPNDPAGNVAFVQAVISGYRESGFDVGMYVGREFPNIFGNTTVFNKFPLWYAHYDGVPSFVDWWGTPYGGWKAPSVKQFLGDGKVKQCSDQDIDWNWKPHAL